MDREDRWIGGIGGIGNRVSSACCSHTAKVRAGCNLFGECAGCS